MLELAQLNILHYLTILQFFRLIVERVGNKIIKVMENLNIPKNNIIFVDVDCDILKDDFRKYIIPYFEKINKY